MKLLIVTGCGMLVVASFIGVTSLSRRPGFKVEGKQTETTKVNAKQSETKAEYLEAKAKFEKGLTDIIAEDVKNAMKDPDSVLLRNTILYHHGEDLGDDGSAKGNICSLRRTERQDCLCGFRCCAQPAFGHQSPH